LRFRRVQMFRPPRRHPLAPPRDEEVCCCPGKLTVPRRSTKPEQRSPGRSTSGRNCLFDDAGFSREEASSLVKELFEERAATVRGNGIMRIVMGFGLMCVPVVALFIFMSVE